MAKQKEQQLDDARRQGQFEGQVLTTLTAIKAQVDAIGAGQSNLETRVRTSENTINTHTEGFKESERIHTEFATQLRTVTDNVDGLVKYQSLQRGVIIALGVLSTIITPIITSFILKFLIK